MNLLLTGDPRSGKTTLLEGFIEAVPDRQGFVAREIREEGERMGFELVSSLGQTATLASTSSKSEIRVSRYGVEVGQLDHFMDGLPPIRSSSLLYVDEIGQMELFSGKFKKLTMAYLDADNPYAGTITSVFKNDFIEAVLAREDVVLLRIEPNNRDRVRAVLEDLAPNIKLLQQLDPEVRRELIKAARDYTNFASLTQLRRLFGTIKHLVVPGKAP